MVVFQIHVGIPVCYLHDQLSRPCQFQPIITQKLWHLRTYSTKSTNFNAFIYSHMLNLKEVASAIPEI